MSPSWDHIPPAIGAGLPKASYHLLGFHLMELVVSDAGHKLQPVSLHPAGTDSLRLKEASLRIWELVGRFYIRQGEA